MAVTARQRPRYWFDLFLSWRIQHRHSHDYSRLPNCSGEFASGRSEAICYHLQHRSRHAAAINATHSRHACIRGTTKLPHRLTHMEAVDDVKCPDGSNTALDIWSYRTYQPWIAEDRRCRVKTSKVISMDVEAEAERTGQLLQRWDRLNSVRAALRVHWYLGSPCMIAVSS